jgi:hypothetical protein
MAGRRGKHCGPARLAIFVDSLGLGGIGKVRTHLANEFARQGLQVDLLVARRDSPYLAQLHPDVRVLDVGTSPRCGRAAGSDPAHASTPPSIPICPDSSRRRASTSERRS